MAFMAKQRAQRHYNTGTRIAFNAYESSSPKKALWEAITHLQSAVLLDPSFADAFHNLAHAWYNLAEYKIADHNVAAASTLSGGGLPPKVVPTIKLELQAF